MRILLVQNFSYAYRRGGAHKANRVLLEDLAARGHVCRVVAPASADAGSRRPTDFLASLTASGVRPILTGDAVQFFDRGVEVHAVIEAEPSWRSDRLRAHLARSTPAFAPDWIIVVDDYAGLLVKAAQDIAPERVIYLAHTPAALPVGPAAYFPRPEGAARLRTCAGILTVSHYMHDYLQRWARCDSAVVRFPVYGTGPFPRADRFDRSLVTFVNPTAIKGLPIFLALARQHPDVAFGAVPTWGTSAAELAQLRELPNVRLLPAADDIDDVFAHTRALLVPSLWGEAFGQIVVEAMLRGIPVLASNSGGLPEAKLGVDYVLPVRMIERYEQRFSEEWLPVPIIEQQDIGPWHDALRDLLAARERYDAIAGASHTAAQAFISNLSVTPVERYLTDLAQSRALRHARHSMTTPRQEPPAEPVTLSADRRTLLALRLRQKRAGVAREPSIRPRPSAQPVPLSFAQQRLWFLERLNPGQPHIHVAIHFKGALDLPVVQRCLTEIVRRHEVLRTTFPEVDGQPVQEIHPAAEVPLPRHSLRHLPANERQDHARRAVVEAIQEPIDLAHGPVLRASVFELGAAEHILLIVMHHIVSDGWSAGILTSELASLYRAFVAGQPSPLPELKIQYGDFAYWQTTQQQQTLTKQIAYWQHKLAGIPTVCELATDYRRPAIQTYRGARRAISLPGELSRALKDLGQREGATVFMTLLAAFQALLARYTGQLNIAVGTPVANRNQIEIEPLLGSFVNMLIMRADLSGAPSFRELLRRVRGASIEAFANQDAPFEMIVDALRPERDLSRNPVFQIAFIMQSATVAAQALPGLEVGSFVVDNETINFDLSLAVWDHPEGLQLFLDYNTDLFAPATIERMLGHLRNLLDAIVAHPEQSVFTLPLLGADERRALLASRAPRASSPISTTLADEVECLDALPVLSDAEREQAVRGWSATSTTYPSARCIHELFEAQAARTPESLALVCGGARLSYRELDAAANRVAHGLRARGVGPDVLVGLFMERSVEMVVGLLGILKAGGAYVPLDPGYPPSRLLYMLEDSGCRLVLSQEALLGRLGDGGREVLALDGEAWLRERAGHGDTALKVGLTSRHLAYVIYTSGSTGQPKGVMIEHRGVVNLFLSIHRMIGLSSTDRWLATTSMSFDIAALELYSSLIAGGAVVLATGTQARDPAWLSAEIAASGATVMQSTPALWSVLLEQPGWAPPAGFRMLCGGEALGPGLHARLTDGAGRAWNVYGPTETTIWSSAAEVRKDERISIGAGLANTQLYVLDGQREPVPVGVVGELYIGGAGVARGYLNQPELTAERFMPDPFSGDPDARLYRTGDLARWLPDGTLEYVGRSDTQVKIRGYRIELGEIEAVLSQAPGVREAVVMARTEGEGKRLVAYVVPEGGEGGPEGVEESGRGVRVAAYRQHLQAQLPGYMVPELYVELAAMPLTGNGKLDRKALPAPAESDLDRAAYVAPRTKMESQLVELWQSVLKLPRVGVEDNFFALGGHSLLATRLVSQVRKEFGVEVPLRSLFERPTVAGFAEALQALSGAEAVLPPIRRVERDGDEATLVAVVTGKRKAKKMRI